MAKQKYAHNQPQSINRKFLTEIDTQPLKLHFRAHQFIYLQFILCEMVNLYCFKYGIFLFSPIYHYLRTNSLHCSAKLPHSCPICNFETKNSVYHRDKHHKYCTLQNSQFFLLIIIKLGLKHVTIECHFRYVDQFSRCLYVEYKNNGIDVQCQVCSIF